MHSHSLARETLTAYEQQQQQQKPCVGVIVRALKACSRLGDLQAGQSIHRTVVDNGDVSNVLVANTLLDMYAKCGRMPESRAVFEGMQHQTVVSWTALVMGYAENGQGEMGWDMYLRMQEGGCRPNHVTLLAALKACASVAANEQKEAAFERVKAIHQHATQLGLLNTLVANSLLGAYTKCDRMEDASRVFESMPRKRDVVCWNCIIMGHAQHGEAELALQLFGKMWLDECAGPDRATILAVLRACSSLASSEAGKLMDGKTMKLESLQKGRAVHALAAKNGLVNDPSVENSLVDMYSKCGSMAEADRVFEEMSQRTAVSWNCIIMGYAFNGECRKALERFSRMQTEFRPSALTLVAVLRACSGLAAKEAAPRVHDIHLQASKSGYLQDPLLAGTLVDAYGRIGCMHDALEVFESIARRTVVSWCAIISGYAQNGEEERALQFYARMQEEDSGCRPDDGTLVAVLKACSRLAEKEEGTMLELVKSIHAQALKAGLHSIVLTGALVDAYSRCRSMEDARSVFESSLLKDVVLWNTMISGYAQSGNGETALELYDRMQAGGCCLPDAVTMVAALKACACLAGKERNAQYLAKGMAIHEQARGNGWDRDMFVATTLISMYSNFGSMVNARRVFDEMAGEQTVIPWNCIISGYANAGEAEQALKLYSEMTRAKGLTPVASTFVSALKACASIAALETGRQIHSDMKMCLEVPATNVANALINMYCKCGSMHEAEHVFFSCSRDLVSWTSLMCGYSRQGDAQRVLELFERMLDEGLQPNGVMFLAVLTACSHTGLSDRGEELFESMGSKYGVVPGMTHWNCMIDMFGRVGLLNRALETLDRMPFQPGEVSWMTILAASRKWKDVAVGKLAFDSLLKLNTASTAYVLMSGIYRREGMLAEAAAVDLMRKRAGFRSNERQQSCWTDKEVVVHTFGQECLNPL